MQMHTACRVEQCEDVDRSSGSCRLEKENVFEGSSGAKVFVTGKRWWRPLELFQVEPDVSGSIEGNFSLILY